MTKSKHHHESLRKHESRENKDLKKIDKAVKDMNKHQPEMKKKRK